MNAKVSLLSLFLFFSPIFVLAQGSAEFVASRYCPDQSKIFTGLYEENGKPWIEVKVDPDFEAKMVKERNLTAPLPLTPVYDLVVRVKPTFNHYCIPGWAGSGREVSMSDIPISVPIEGFISVGKGVALENVVSGGVFSRTDMQDEQKRFIYEWKLHGWPNGITPASAFLRLINEIRKKSPQVLVSIALPRTSGSIDWKIQEIVFNLCAPIWGNGRHHIKGLFTEESLFTESPVEYFDNIRKLFSLTAPFSVYQSSFSYLVDLNMRKQDTYAPILNIWRNRGIRSISYTDREMFFIGSSCSGDGYSLFTLPQDIQTGAALPGLGAVLGRGAGPLAYIHEFAHVFAWLDDEYLYAQYGSPKRKKIIYYDFRNCADTPANDYAYQNKLYGGTAYKGCMFEKEYDSAPLTFYRPSQISIMRHPDFESFNVVSCGYIVAAILNETPTKENASKYWPQCARMTDVIKDGVQASAMYPFFAWLDGIFNPVTSNLQTAAVGNSNDSSSDISYIIVESFDPNNPWGEIIEVVPNETATSPTSQPSITTAPSSSFDTLGDENIFTAVSLDVKINGSDGPVEVRKGDRIVVSWISEGASRCRAVWSKNDIAKSGTVAGRLSKSGTYNIRAACIDTDGNRADDSVAVNVLE